MPYFEITPADQRLAELDRPRRFETSLIGAFAATALILAAIGLYGLMRYSVEQRTKEFAIRISLGATRSDIVQLILRQGLRWASIGIIVGAAGALASGRALSNLLFGVTGADTATLGAVITLLAVVAVGASSFPARSATLLDPNTALRE